MDNSTLLEVFRNYHDSEIDGVLFSNKENAIFFNVMNFPHRHLSFTKDQLLSGSRVYYFPKNSILKDVFNRRIQIFHESGLINFWYVQRILVNNNKNLKEMSQSALHIENVFGVIYVCATMYLISFVVFFCEVISLICPPLRLILNFLNY